MTSASSFASRISLSSASARRHCSPFPHQRQRPPPLLVIPARADHQIVADDVALQLRLPRLAQQRQRRLPMLVLPARADHSNVALMTSASSFASRISLSSASARRHCSPFLHAPMPAL
ncbi:unnamed protein product [Prorocentrum cordatum]|uniref:Uncharacterized protein n=1 Tax=Prorocentrum cordatum TaxID=2364126 RepID=A0ABN9UN14_9DINO|nr:unnamed protein product [Polarella glacialis]